MSSLVTFLGIVIGLYSIIVGTMKSEISYVILGLVCFVLAKQFSDDLN